MNPDRASPKKTSILRRAPRPSAARQRPLRCSLSTTPRWALRTACWWTNFINFSIKNKIDLVGHDGLPHAQCVPHVTDCAMAELGEARAEVPRGASRREGPPLRAPAVHAPRDVRGRLHLPKSPAAQVLHRRDVRHGPGSGGSGKSRACPSCTCSSTGTPSVPPAGSRRERAQPVTATRSRGKRSRGRREASA